MALSLIRPTLGFESNYWEEKHVLFVGWRYRLSDLHWALSQLLGRKHSRSDNDCMDAGGRATQEAQAEERHPTADVIHYENVKLSS